MHHAVALISLQAQLQAGATSNRPVQMLQYGAEGPVDSSKCTAVAFIPGSEGTVFAAAHWSGTVIIHIKVCICHATAWDVHAASLLMGVQGGAVVVWGDERGKRLLCNLVHPHSLSFNVYSLVHSLPASD